MIGSQATLTDARVRNAIEDLYRQFTAPVPSEITGCPCCLAKRGVDALLATPLRELTGQALWSYVSGVFYTVGSESDFKYLLPRILEVALEDPGDSNNPEIVLGKVGLAGGPSWPAGQRDAIEAFIDIWFERRLAEDLAEIADGWLGWAAESVLCGAARGGFALSRWLVRLQEPDAAPVLADLKKRFPDELSPFWEDVPEGLAEFSEILTR